MLAAIEIGNHLELVIIIAIVIFSATYKGNSERKYK